MGDAAHPLKPPTTGRLAILTGMSLAAAAIPVPFLPDRVVLQIRGALVHDVCARHGLSLTTDGRRALAEPSAESPVREVLKSGLGILSKTVLKKLSPLTKLFTAAAALEVYAIGHLVDRYLERHRGAPSVRINGGEARALRKLIDAAVVRALSPTLHQENVPLLAAPEDLRDEFTRWIDTLILLGAGLPGYVERRLDTAFDAVIAEQGAPPA